MKSLLIWGVLFYFDSAGLWAFASIQTVAPAKAPSSLARLSMLDPPMLGSVWSRQQSSYIHRIQEGQASIPEQNEIV
jgi:hypothetical protein